MNFKVDPKIFENYPDLLIGVLVIRDADNTGSNQEITELLRKEEALVRERLSGYEIVGDVPELAAQREVHKKYGGKPTRYRPSVESLVRRVRKGDELPSINKLVDLYNFISIRYLVPVGGEDTDACQGDIELAYADGTEEFISIGSDKNDPPELDEVVYKDSVGVICRRFNWREGDRTKLDEKTTNCVIVAEAVPPVSKDTLERALDDLSGLITKHCLAKVETDILNTEKNTIDL